MNNVIYTICIFILTVAISACGSSGSGTSGTSKTFPTSIAPDVSEVTTGDLPTSLNPKDLGLGLKAIPSSGDFAEPISASTNVVQMMKLITDSVLGGMATGMNNSVTASTFQASGTVLSKTIKVDFSKFDFDGDDSKDGSGSATAPISMRTWADNERMMSGLITTAPTFDSDGSMTSAGAGTVIVSPPTILTSSTVSDYGMGSDVTINVSWDHTNSANKTFTAYPEGQVFSVDGGETADIESMKLTINIISEDVGTRYLLKMGGYFTNDAVVGPSGAFSSLQMIATWFEDGSNILFRMRAYGSSGELLTDYSTDSGYCASLTTGNAASGSDPEILTECTDEGLDLSDESYIDRWDDTTTADFQSVSDFRSSPTF